MFLYTPPDLWVFTLTVRPPVKCRVEPGFSTHVYLAWPPSRQSTLFLNSFNTQHPSLLYSWHRNFHILRSISTLFWIFLQDCCVSSREIRRFDKICSWKLSNIQYFFIGLLHSFSSTHTVQCTAFLIYIYSVQEHTVQSNYIIFCFQNQPLSCLNCLFTEWTSPCRTRKFRYFYPLKILSLHRGQNEFLSPRVPSLCLYFLLAFSFALLPPTCKSGENVKITFSFQ